MADGRDTRSVTLGDGREFDLIRRLLAEGIDLPPEVRVGPGDDAAVLDRGMVLSTDLSVEDVHFRRSWLSDAEIGYRAGAAALSDLAAMAASPVGLLVSLAAPRGGAVDMEAVHRGVRQAGAAVGAAVLGGDLSRSPGPLIVDVTVVGYAERPVLRAGAAAGDELWVTGTLGAAAAAVAAWECGEEPAAEIRRRFAHPEPRVAEARTLAEQDALHALIDLSDGLAGDAGHIGAASSVRVVIEADRVPVDPAVLATYGPDRALELALHGGEDYELCFAVAAGAVDAGDFQERFGLALTRVGRVEAGEGVWLEKDGATQRVAGGFDHLGDGA